jgi:hypothetical protein
VNVSRAIPDCRLPIGNGRQSHGITRKGAGTVISAVRSQALGPFKAARALVRRKLKYTPTAGVIASHIENFVEEF